MDSVSLISGRFLWNGKYLFVRPKGQPSVFLEQLRAELMRLLRQTSALDRYQQGCARVLFPTYTVAPRFFRRRLQAHEKFGIQRQKQKGGEKRPDRASKPFVGPVKMTDREQLLPTEAGPHPWTHSHNRVVTSQHSAC